jgi:parallel beta-helix repeat protein
VAAGQTVQVAAGTYPEAVTVATSGTSAAPISFTAAPGATVTLSGKANGFSISGKSWISITGFHVTNTTSYGIVAKNSAHITIVQNEVSYSGKPVSGSTRFGIRLENTVDSEVAGNTAHHNTDAGIAVLYDSTRNQVHGNHTYANARGYVRAAPGIRLYYAPGNTVYDNVSHHNEDSGIECYTDADNTLLYNNVTYDNGDHGIDNLRATGQTIVGNTVYRNVTAGINVEGGSTGATIRNSISVDNGIASPRTRSNIRVDKGLDVRNDDERRPRTADETERGAADLGLEELLHARSLQSRDEPGNSWNRGRPDVGESTGRRLPSHRRLACD